jgi:hypothetical protein
MKYAIDTIGAVYYTGDRVSSLIVAAKLAVWLTPRSTIDSASSITLRYLMRFSDAERSQYQRGGVNYCGPS